MGEHKMALVTKYGHVDLLIERDSGNEILILMGSNYYALPAWRKLRNICDKAIGLITDSDPKKAKFILDSDTAALVLNMLNRENDKFSHPRKRMLLQELNHFMEGYIEPEREVGKP